MKDYNRVSAIFNLSLIFLNNIKIHADCNESVTIKIKKSNNIYNKYFIKILGHKKGILIMGTFLLRDIFISSQIQECNEYNVTKDIKTEYETKAE